MADPITIGGALGAIFGGLLGAVGAAFTYLNALVGESWTRYFILVGGLLLDNVIGNFTGLYVLEGLLSFVIVSISGIQGFGFPVYYGVSSLLIIVVTMPLIVFVVNIAANR